MEYLLPHYVEKESNILELRSLLDTKNGRVIGNAYISKVLDNDFFEVTTQFHTLILSSSEIKTMFFKPRGVLKESCLWTAEIKTGVNYDSTTQDKPKSTFVDCND